MADSHFRGYWAIREVVEKLERLGGWMEEFKPQEPKVLTLKRKDYDLLKRWPKAASVFPDLHTAKGEVFWKGFKLRADAGPSRYGKKEIPINEEIT